MKEKAIEVDLREIAERSGKTLEEVMRTIKEVRRMASRVTRQIKIRENGEDYLLKVARTGIGIINTDFGQFYEMAFDVDDQWQRYIVIAKCHLNSTFDPVFSRSHLLIRTDSGCETGQVFGDKTCECREQLHLALQEIAREGEGLVIHIPHQDGRGMGTPFKLATLYLQEVLGMNTVESAVTMSNGEEFDVRTYGGVIAVMRFLGISNETKINLATNNPRKAGVFNENGYEIARFHPVRAPVTERLRQHLAAKESYLGHICLL